MFNLNDFDVRWSMEAGKEIVDQAIEVDVGCAVGTDSVVLEYIVDGGGSSGDHPAIGVEGGVRAVADNGQVGPVRGGGGHVDVPGHVSGVAPDAAGQVDLEIGSSVPGVEDPGTIRLGSVGGFDPEHDREFGHGGVGGEGFVNFVVDPVELVSLASVAVVPGGGPPGEGAVIASVGRIDCAGVGGFVQFPVEHHVV